MAGFYDELQTAFCIYIKVLIKSCLEGERDSLNSIPTIKMKASETKIKIRVWDKYLWLEQRQHNESGMLGKYMPIYYALHSP